MKKRLLLFALISFLFVGTTNTYAQNDFSNQLDVELSDNNSDKIKDKKKDKKVEEDNQLEFLGYKAINNGGEETANILLDIRNGRKFEVAVVDRCVFNYFITYNPHPTKGFIPGTNEPNGITILGIDKDCFGIKFIQKVLKSGGTLYFHDSVEDLNIELETLLPGITIIENVGDGLVSRN